MAKKRQGKQGPNKPKDEFEQQIIDLARVTRVMAGGKRLRFRACMVIGDRKGRIGFGVAKGADVALAIGKAVARAKKNMITVPLVNDSIPHIVRIKYKSAKVLLKPAPHGTGIIAGGAVRQVLELAGVPNVVAKILGCNNKINNVKAVFEAIEQMQLQSGTRSKQQDKRVAKNITAAALQGDEKKKAEAAKPAKEKATAEKKTEKKS